MKIDRKKRENLTYREALEAMKEGFNVKLPEWTGYWYIVHGQIVVFAKNGDLLANPWVGKFSMRNDWEITEGNMGFDFAVMALKNGKKLSRKGWNGKGMWIQGQFPDEHSKMTLPYVFMKTADNQQVPWLASQTDIMAEDWEVVRP